MHTKDFFDKISIWFYLSQCSTVPQQTSLPARASGLCQYQQTLLTLYIITI